MSDSTPNQPQTKVCHKCRMSKPLAEFHRSKRSKDGLVTECKGCVSARGKEWRVANAEHKRQGDAEYRSSNREKLRAYLRDWYQRNAEQQKEKVRQWSRTNADRKSASDKRYAIARPDVRKAARLRYRKRHPEYSKVQKARRRARLNAANGHFTKEDIQLIGNSQKWRCWYCEADCKSKYHIDHRIPLSRGGSNDPSNLVIACPPCNLSKNDKLPHEWSDRLL